MSDVCTTQEQLDAALAGDGPITIQGHPDPLQALTVPPGTDWSRITVLEPKQP